MENLFDSLLKVTGEKYLEKEQQLLIGGEKSISVLKLNLNSNDSFTRIYAKTMLEWMEGYSPNNNAAISYLDTLLENISGTAITSPSPVGAASYLSLHFHASVTNILAVHLIKLPDLPYWRIATVLIYLEEQKPQEITEILLRFITESSDDELVDTALDAIDAINDPQLDSKILQEEIRLKLQDLSLPVSLKNRLQ